MVSKRLRPDLRVKESDLGPVIGEYRKRPYATYKHNVPGPSRIESVVIFILYLVALAVVWSLLMFAGAILIASMGR